MFPSIDGDFCKQHIQKVLFLKISISFPSLIPFLNPPTDERENSNSTPRDQKVRFVKIAIYVFGHEWRFFCVCTCKNEKNIVPLHRKPKVCRHIKKRLLALVLVDRNPAKFRNPKQESGKCPLVCLIRCVPQRLTYRRGHSLFILVTGSCRNLYRKNKQKEVPRFFC